MDIFILFFAGVLGGALNSLAGGGSFITFPALVFVGIPPIIANATNTFAACPGYLSGAFAFKAELLAHKKQLVKYIVLSFFGGILGAWLLTQTSAKDFARAVPWLLLFATILFIYGGKLNALLQKFSVKNQRATTITAWGLNILFLLVSLYGGFFNAGLGIILLSYLSLAGYKDINLMNGIKLLSSSCGSLIAIVLFAFDGLLVWREGFVVLVGVVIGGYFAAKLSRRLPQQSVRNFVILISIATTLYFFYAQYKPFA